MRRKFCCDASRGMYEDYYCAAASQRGAGGVYQGARGMRGHGLGSILSGFFRSALPLLKRGLSFFGKEALRTGARIANDVADGQSLGDATKKRVRERINEYAPGLIDQSGSGRRRIRRYNVAKSLPKRIKRKRPSLRGKRKRRSKATSAAKRRKLTGSGIFL